MKRSKKKTKKKERKEGRKKRLEKSDGNQRWPPGRVRISPDVFRSDCRISTASARVVCLYTSRVYTSRVYMRITDDGRASVRPGVRVTGYDAGYAAPHGRCHAHRMKGRYTLCSIEENAHVERRVHVT